MSQIIGILSQTIECHCNKPVVVVDVVEVLGKVEVVVMPGTGAVVVEDAEIVEKCTIQREV